MTPRFKKGDRVVITLANGIPNLYSKEMEIHEVAHQREDGRWSYRVRYPNRGKIVKHVTISDTYLITVAEWELIKSTKGVT